MRESAYLDWAGDDEFVGLVSNTFERQKYGCFGNRTNPVLFGPNEYAGSSE